MPDDGLFAAAEGGNLNGERLKKEVDRLLTDGKSNRFVNDFARQWLQLHRVGMFPPDKKLLPNVRRLAGGEHAFGARRIFPRDVREEPPHRRVHRFRLDDGEYPTL